jgi:hypothetical protein
MRTMRLRRAPTAPSKRGGAAHTSPQHQSINFLASPSARIPLSTHVPTRCEPPLTAAFGLLGLAVHIMEELNFALKQAFAPRTPDEIDRLQREAEIRRSLGEAAAAARDRQWQDGLWLEEQRRRQYQQEIEAIHARARRRRATSRLITSMPVYAAPLPAPGAKLRSTRSAEVGSLALRGNHDSIDREANRTTIKSHFRQAAKQTVQHEETAKSRQRKRRGETEGQFRQLMRRMMRRFDMRPQFRNAASKAGRRSTANTAPPDTFAGFTGSPWSSPLNGMDFYAGDLAGFADFDEGLETDLYCHNSLE